jgi:hypothetical protein
MLGNRIDAFTLMEEKPLEDCNDKVCFQIQESSQCTGEKETLSAVIILDRLTLSD